MVIDFLANRSVFPEYDLFLLLLTFPHISTRLFYAVILQSGRYAGFQKGVGGGLHFDCVIKIHFNWIKAIFQ